MNKPRILKDYDQLPDEIVEQIKLAYPLGFSHHLVSFTNKNGERKMGLPFETDKVYYLVRMNSVQADKIIENDDDFNNQGHLKVSAREEYEERHSDVSYLGFNDNSDNSLTFDMAYDEEEDDF